MQVNVWNSLRGIRTAIKYRSITARQSILGSNLLCDDKHMSDQRSVIFRKIIQ